MCLAPVSHARNCIGPARCSRPKWLWSSPLSLHRRAHLPLRLPFGTSPYPSELKETDFVPSQDRQRLDTAQQVQLYSSQSSFPLFKIPRKRVSTRIEFPCCEYSSS